MKKVLFVATVTGHINVFHLPFLKLFKDNNYEVHVATGDNKGVKEYCDKKINVGIKRNPLSTSNVKAIKKLQKLIDTEKYDIIHCHTPMGGVVARLAARKAREKYGTRLIYTAHGFHFFKGAPIKNWLLYYPIELYLAKFTDTIITINHEDYYLAKKKFKKCKDIQYVPGVGINLDRFRIKLNENQKEKLRELLSISKDDFVISCIARLDLNKNQKFIIDAFENLVKKNKKYHLLLVGIDELNGYYQSIVSCKGLNDNVHFLGSRNDVPDLLQISDVVVSASKREGLPVNIIEAFAAGIPVVVLNCRGMSDLVCNGENGFIIDNSSSNKIYQFTNLLEIISNYDIKKIKLIRQNNIKKSMTYSIENIIKVYYKIYFN